MVEKAGRKNNLYDVSSEYDVEVTRDNALKFTNSTFIAVWQMMKIKE